MQEDPSKTDSIKLKILEAKAFKYPTNLKKPDGYNGSGVLHLLRLIRNILKLHRKWRLPLTPEGRFRLWLGPKVSIGVDCDVTSLNFITGRPLLHLIRHRNVKGTGDSDDTVSRKKAKTKEKKENDDENLKVLIKHDDIVTGNWLEVRRGDAALIDLVQVKKHRTQLALCLLDRRIESLTRVALSTRTAGFTAAGGEAGLVFLMPTMI
ncbi:unnamed protein product [Bursaphelenchus okinawaensis]|uniref:Uncharacterized protein n=1 Tax=Bursaphelenchus okinawaensis TaxID=465554 RepID=A0A811JWI1_9BILA|nr:unnamed protein product [Bursaphelenchus okinawaensis]CAG9086324.1 unnamed protein product [Bursaphelenchus okinawaensis]